MSFDARADACEKWLECEATAMQTNGSYRISLYRDRGTLSSLYFSMSQPPSPTLLCSVPIDESTAAFYYHTRLFLNFRDLDNITIGLNLGAADLSDIAAQIAVNLRKPASRDEQFAFANALFLRTISVSTSAFSAAAASPGLETVSPQVTFDRSLVKTPSQAVLWESRFLSLNSAYTCEFARYRIGFLTWNTASVKPNQMVLSELSQAFEIGSHPADVVFISLQEIDMGVVSVVSGSSRLKNQWSRIISTAVARTSGFGLQREESLGGVYAALITRFAAVPAAVCGDVRCIRMGAHGLANKGAIVFGLTVGAARFVFVGCHLTPHSENWESRNEQIRQLLREVDGKYDYLVIIGDLNYRIEMTYEECRAVIDRGAVAELNAKDQLTITRSSDAAIARLKEPPRAFMPTYKFDADSDEYDTSPKHRVPSWTDRILTKRGRRRLAIATANGIVWDFLAPEKLNFPSMPRCVAYTSGKCRFSDHRSVTSASVFNVPVVKKKEKRPARGSNFVPFGVELPHQATFDHCTTFSAVILVCFPIPFTLYNRR
jgi:hypothetical protein